MHPINARHRRTHRRRGTAMFEAVLALPLFMLILLFIVYFGRNYVRIERAQVMDRYQAWRDAGHGPGPGANEPRGNTHMNDTFFNNTAESIHHGGDRAFPDDAPLEWISRAGQLSDPAAELAQAMTDNLSTGRSAHFSTTHRHENKYLQRFAGAVEHGHTVLDHHWKYVNGWPRRGGPWDQRGPSADNLGSLRDAFYEDFDSTLEGMGDQGNPFARMMRDLYLSRPGYRGPEVP